MVDGKVTAIGHSLAATPTTVRIDARGRWVTPELIDIHSHDGTYVEPLTTEDQTSNDVSELSDPNAAGPGSRPP